MPTHTCTKEHAHAHARTHQCTQARRYDACMQRYEEGAVKTMHSLASLNLGQSWIFTAAMTAAMLSTAHVGGLGAHRCAWGWEAYSAPLARCRASCSCLIN